MTASRIEDLADVSTEHLLGLATGLPLVKMRCESDDTVLVGQLTPEQARDIASHLLESAARAEYEHDAMTAMKEAGMDDAAIGAIFHFVRAGEFHRHTA